MKHLLSKTFSLLVFLFTLTSGISQADNVSTAPNGITYPIGLKNWRIISTSYRTDNNTQRAILGNSIAIKASRAGHINPWPKGAILAKLVWKNTQHPQWDSASVPGQFVHSEIMIKDSVKFKKTGGWGYARWKGKEQQPYGNDASFAKECFSCHTHAKDSDYVFTEPPMIP